MKRLVERVLYLGAVALLGGSIYSSGEAVGRDPLQEGIENNVAILNFDYPEGVKRALTRAAVLGILGITFGAGNGALRKKREEDTPIKFLHSNRFELGF